MTEPTKDTPGGQGCTSRLARNGVVIRCPWVAGHHLEAPKLVRRHGHSGTATWYSGDLDEITDSMPDYCCDDATASADEPILLHTGGCPRRCNEPIPWPGGSSDYDCAATDGHDPVTGPADAGGHWRPDMEATPPQEPDEPGDEMTGADLRYVRDNAVSTAAAMLDMLLRSNRYTEDSFGDAATFVLTTAARIERYVTTGTTDEDNPAS
jgi:hypothetical protein